MVPDVKTLGRLAVLRMDAAVRAVLMEKIRIALTVVTVLVVCVMENATR